MVLRENTAGKESFEDSPIYLRSMAAALIIFIKNPRLGKVKTRLASTVGEAEALRIYRILLEKTREAALGLTGVRRLLFYSDFVETGDGWPEADFEKHLQRGEDLGARMAAAFQDAFASGASRAIIIGSDCPDLSAGLLKAAFAWLQVYDVVLGPTPDGGYYLLGMKQLHLPLFEGIAWSTDTVRARTLEKIKALGLRRLLFPEYADIDTEEDWRNRKFTTA